MRDLGRAGAKWSHGNVDAAGRLAGEQPPSDARLHLLILAALVRGKFEMALTLYDGLNSSYEEVPKLDEPIVEGLLQLDRPNEAHGFAVTRRMEETRLNELELRAAHPLEATLKGTTVVPFAEHPLTPFFPAFHAELDGEPLVAHLDTGASFLVMGPERARRFGIETMAAGTGLHGTSAVPLEMGRANRFRLGDAALSNVPVAILPSLQGEQDFVIFGISILRKFLPTVDYPNARLILAPRENQRSTRQRSATMGEQSTVLPFYLWGDHFMFARGGFGDRKDLNYFIDSGLVSLAPGTGGIRQACLATTSECYAAWGVDPLSAAKDHFETPLPLSLGPLEQRGLFFATIENPTWSSFGGVRIDGLLGHAFLKQYAWTLDFDNYRYIFSQPGEEACS